jgi:hypothetical protein
MEQITINGVAYTIKLSPTGKQYVELEGRFTWDGAMDIPLPLGWRISRSDELLEIPSESNGFAWSSKAPGYGSNEQQAWAVDRKSGSVASKNKSDECHVILVKD